MKKKFGDKRYFLNPKEGVAAASFSVHVDNNIKRRDYCPSIDAEASLTISDCTRQINLEFETWLGDDIKEAKKVLDDRRIKLTRLKGIVDEFVTAAEKAYDYIEDRLPEYEKAMKEFEEQKKKKK
tara:strand:+ start:891 stop:1265 length:375 start_codon:yes stop_codon:yes gene_type:complete